MWSRRQSKIGPHLLLEPKKENRDKINLLKECLPYLEEVLTDYENLIQIYKFQHNCYPPELEKSDVVKLIDLIRKIEKEI